MKFSIIYEGATADITRAGEQALYNGIVAQAELADELGFDVIWSVEHTSLTWYSHISAPNRCSPSSPVAQSAFMSATASSACRSR